MRADVVLVPPVVGDLDAEPDRDAAGRPAFGRGPDDAFALGERDEVEGRRPRRKVDVVRDRELGNPALGGLCGVRVDRDVAVGRQVRVEMAVERQVARLRRATERIGVHYPAIRPSSRPTVANASSAWSSCSSAWAAVTIVRIRALLIATVGKTTGWAKTPSSNSRWLNRPAVAGAPTITGLIGASHPPLCNPTHA